MLETTTSVELQNLTQHLVRQPSARAVLAEFIHQVRMSGLPIAYPRALPGDVSAHQIAGDDALIVHLPGNSNRAILIGVGTHRPAPPPEDFGTGLRMRPMMAGERVVHELDKNGLPRSIYGPGALTMASPLAIAWWLMRELQQLGDDLPGHVLLAVVPGSFVGGEVFERAGERVQQIITEHRLKPLAALVPGRLRPGAASTRKKNIVVSTGSAGLMTVQFFVAGDSAAPTSRFRMLDPVALTAALVHDLTMGDRLAADNPNLPPPVMSAMSSGMSCAPGWSPGWAGCRVSVFVDEPDPAALMKSLLAVSASVFESHLARLNQQFGAHKRLIGGDRPASRPLPWQPTVMSFRELRRSCRFELPAIERRPDGLDEVEALEWAQEQALRRVRFAYEHSPHAGTPMIVASLVPPTLPPFRMDPEDALVFPALKKTAKEYQALRATTGLFADAWQRLALSAWASKCARTAQDESPLGNEPKGFGLRSEWGSWPLIGFGPVGRDAGTRSECVDIEPSFTRLPEFLRMLIVRALALEERPRLVDSAWTRLRRWSSRLGLIKKTEVRDDDDHLLFPDALPVTGPVSGTGSTDSALAAEPPFPSGDTHDAHATPNGGPDGGVDGSSGMDGELGASAP